MTRNPQAGSNTRPANVVTFGNVPSYQFYEQVYSTVGPQEWITLPDSGQSKVYISFPTGSGSAFLQGTCSPPDMCYNPSQGSLSPLNYRGPYSPVLLDLTDGVTDITAITIEGESAIRLNVLGGTAAISVRC
jgi:hypothetical protein